MNFLFPGLMMMFSSFRATIAALTCLLVYLSARPATVSILKHFLGFIGNSESSGNGASTSSVNGTASGFASARRFHMLSID